jgi:lysophospholipase L1-like esterase
MAMLMAIGSTLRAAGEDSFIFDFGSGKLANGAVAVPPDRIYSVERGFGFEPNFPVTGFDDPGSNALVDDGVSGQQPFYFSVDLPEGNYRIKATIGARKSNTSTTIKAELRRLMVEKAETTPGEFVTLEFIVNTRTPQIAAIGDIEAGIVRLKKPREVTQEAWAWDGSLTLEFNGSHPSVCAIEIEPAVVPTIFIIGDSTVCDQSREPYASWGQMVTAFFKPEVAIANHGESGETYRDSIGRRRLDKMLSVMEPGDWMIMEFGHNDQKQIAKNSGGPFSTYKDEIEEHVDAVRAHGGTPIIVSPMERRGFDENGKTIRTLKDYAAAARQSADELGVSFIDLNAVSIPFYEFLESKGPEYSRNAFAGKDNTHHNNYGAYQLAKAIVQGIIDNQLEIAKYVIDDFSGFDPSHPDPVEAFAVPPSQIVTNVRPLGN